MKSRDTVNCGRGNDTVRADRFDRLRGCENVERVRSKRSGADAREQWASSPFLFGFRV